MKVTSHDFLDRRLRNLRETERDDCTAFGSAFGFELLEQLRFEAIRIDLHFAGRDLLVRSAVKAEFADAETGAFSIFACRANRRTEHATGHGAMRVEIAGPVSGIERGTWFVVREVFELALGALAFAEKSGRELAGKITRDSGDGFFRALANSSGAIGVRVREFGEAFAKASGVELIDGEGANAAWRATWMTDEEVAAAASCVGESNIEDLDEFVVASGARMGDGDQVLEFRTARACQFGSGSPLPFGVQDFRNNLWF